jgi:hypothetical protein
LEYYDLGLVQAWLAKDWYELRNVTDIISSRHSMADLEPPRLKAMVETIYEQLDFTPNPDNAEPSESFEHAGFHVKRLFSSVELSP